MNSVAVLFLAHTKRRWSWLLLGSCLAWLAIGEISDGSVCCEGSSPVERAHLEVVDEFVTVALDCSFVCSGRSTQRVTTRREFHPLEHGLRPGDGSDQRTAPWGAFTGTLESWSRMVCLEEAAERCGGLGEVERSSLERLTSGSWRLDHRVECPTPADITRIVANNGDPVGVLPEFVPQISPFDPESGADRTHVGRGGDRPSLHRPAPGSVIAVQHGDLNRRVFDRFEYWMNKAVSLREIPDHLSTRAEISGFLLKSAGVGSEQEYVAEMLSRHALPAIDSCSVTVTGRACFGDCLEYPDGKAMEQYLGTNKLGEENTGPFVVCADTLQAFFNAHEMSPDSREVYCERFVMESLVHGRAPAVTCSSYRIRADCSPFSVSSVPQEVDPAGNGPRNGKTSSTAHEKPDLPEQLP
jgi:hypothetical protein